MLLGFSEDGSNLAQLFEGREPGVPYDDVIEDLDLEQESCLQEVPGDPEVGEGWGRIERYAVSGIRGVMPHSVLCRMHH